MKKLYSYTYIVLRYIHDTTTGEFMNVGVALYAPETGFLGAKCRTTYGRLNKAFPNINVAHFKSMMRHIQASFNSIGKKFENERSRSFQLSDSESIKNFATIILPNDDSSLQWSPVGSGRTENPELALDRLFKRMVTKYDEAQQHNTRSDDDVWRHFKKELENRNLLNHFVQKSISVDDDEVEFNYAWKNGVWHCLEPISLDLSASETIKDKAHRWLGQFASVKNASDDFKLYLLIGQPHNASLQPAFQNALSILRKIPFETHIFLESDAPQLSELIANEIEEHSQRAVN